MQNIPLYSFFLFTKLYDIIIKADDYAYDVLFDDLVGHYKQYQSSFYNDENKPEYECIVAFLEDNKVGIKTLAELSALSC
jgi:hypothetical protein